MIHRLPVIGAIFAGLLVLAMSLAALFTRLPPFIEEGRFLNLTVRSVVEQTALIDPGLATVFIVVVALLGLTILFGIEFLTPKARRKSSRQRMRGVEDVLDDLAKRGE